MPVYHITIKTILGVYQISFDTNKAKAIRKASSVRRGGDDLHNNHFEAHEIPKVMVQNMATKEVVYCKPLCKKAIRKS
jgi:hypothetical protein